DAFLGAVAPDEMARQPVGPRVVGAGEIAGAGALDLDDPSAEIGQQPGAIGSGDGLLQRNDGDAVERARRHSHACASITSRSPSVAIQRLDRPSPSGAVALTDSVPPANIGDIERN